MTALGTVKLNNFGTFKDASFSFDLPNGLYFLTGRNEEDVKLTTNGCGKSTLLNSLCWALYGKTVEKDKAGSLLNWWSGAKGYSVELEVDNKKLFRSWNPNKLTLDGKDIDPNGEDVNKLVGLNYDQFLQVVLFGQKQEGFIDLTSSEKLEFLSNIFDLNRWTRLAEHCKSEVSNLSPKLAKKIGEKEATIAECENLSLQLDALEGKINDWEEQKRAGIADRQSKIELLKKKVSPGVNTEELEELIKAFEQEVKDSEQFYQECLETERECRTNIQIAETEVIRLKQKIEDLAKRKLDKCPTCGQKLDTSHVNTAICDLEECLEHLPGSTEDQHEALAKAQELSRQALEKLKGIKADQAGLLEEQRKSVLANYERKMHLKEIEIQEQELKKEQDSKNPFFDQQSSLEELLKVKISKIQGIDDDVKFFDEQIAEYSFWQKKFPEIRLSILDEVISELEIHFNSAFAMLGLDNWQISVETERELKNETVKRELILKIVKKDKSIDLSRLSGGEKQRCRMAVALGISDLIKSRLGLKFDLVIFDEPLGDLSQEGQEDALVLLSQIAENRPIIVAEHVPLGLHNFDGIITIVKDSNGYSRVE